MPHLHTGTQRGVFCDPSHRVSNDLKEGIASAGLWSALLLWGIPFSVNFGPYQGASWFRQVQDAARAYADSAHTDCPLLNQLLPRIAKERGEPDRVHDPDYPAEVLASIFEGRVMQKGRSWL